MEPYHSKGHMKILSVHCQDTVAGENTEFDKAFHAAMNIISVSEARSGFGILDTSCVWLQYLLFRFYLNTKLINSKYTFN